MNKGLLILTLAVAGWGDAPWQPNVRVSTATSWDNLDQGESSFDVHDGNVYTICNTAQRGEVAMAPYAYSTDPNPRFIQVQFTEPGGRWLTDPLIEVDDSGHVHMIMQFGTGYMNHYLSRDGGLTWGDGLRFNSLEGVDKPWWVIRENEIYIVWQQVAGSTGIWLAKSTDYGQTFTDRRIWNRTGITGLSMDEEKNIHLVLALFSGSVYYRKSTDRGANWTPEQRLGTVSYQAGYGDRAPITSITASGDNVFITWVSNGSNGSWEVNGVRSANGGASWQSPFIVNDVQTGGQFKSWALFDPFGGLHVQYYHTPDWPTRSSSRFSLRYQYSPDGGATFRPSIRLTDTDWTSHSDFLGEYHIMRSDSLYLYSVWADGRNPDNNDLYFSRALLEDLKKPNAVRHFNPESDQILVTPLSKGVVSISIPPYPHQIDILLYDVYGRLIKKLSKGASKTRRSIEINYDHLAPGIAFFKIVGGEISEVRKVVLKK